MLIKDLMKQLELEIEKIKKKPETLNHNTDNLVYLASQKGYAKFRKFFASFIHDEREANAANLKKMLEYIQTDWEKSMDTDVIYPHNVDTYINRILILIAEKVGAITGIPYFKILMPSLLISNDQLQDLQIKKLNCFVLSDDNTTLIDVFACLENAQKENPSILKHTHPVKSDHNELSESEKERVIKHSNQTLHYYHAFSSEPRRSDRAIARAKNDLRKNLNMPVTSSYGYKGATKLARQLYGEIKNRESLIWELLEYPPIAWKDFLDNLKLEELVQFVLGDKPFLKVLQDNASYNQYEHFNRASLYVFVYLYKKQLEGRNAMFTSRGGSFTGYSKQEKSAGASLELNFLLNRPLNEFEDFLKSDECKKLLGALTSRQSFFKKLYPDTLHLITDQILKVAHPEFIKMRQLEIENESEKGLVLA